MADQQTPRNSGFRLFTALVAIDALVTTCFWVRTQGAIVRLLSALADKPTERSAAAVAGHVRQSSRARTEHGTVSIAFEPNLGQANSAARFLAHERNSTLYLTADSATIVVTHVPDGISRRAANAMMSVKAETDSSIVKRIHASALTMKFEGAASSPTITGEDELAGRSNYSSERIRQSGTQRFRPIGKSNTGPFILGLTPSFMALTANSNTTS